jgi:hypothetical protein
MRRPQRKMSPPSKDQTKQPP